ncbi:MAG: hypothetical protein H6559_26420 [Lewinellaceae bacterium]|nr:hypothetical protein [Lewinellaceae bacterium]
MTARRRKTRGGDDTVDSDADPNTGLTGTITVNSGETDLTNDAGFYEPASLGDFVWSDTDADGIQDAGEPGIGGVTVNLLDGGGAFLASTTTAPDGSYSFTNLAPGDYIVEFIGPAGFAPSPQDQGGDDTIDSDANPGTGQTGIITLSSGENDPTNDAGYYESRLHRRLCLARHRRRRHPGRGRARHPRRYRQPIRGQQPGRRSPTGADSHRRDRRQRRIRLPGRPGQLRSRVCNAWL